VKSPLAFVKHGIGFDSSEECSEKSKPTPGASASSCGSGGLPRDQVSAGVLSEGIIYYSRGRFCRARRGRVPGTGAGPLAAPAWRTEARNFGKRFGGSVASDRHADALRTPRQYNPEKPPNGLWLLARILRSSASSLQRPYVRRFVSFTYARSKATTSRQRSAFTTKAPWWYQLPVSRSSQSYSSGAATTLLREGVAVLHLRERLAVPFGVILVRKDLLRAPSRKDARSLHAFSPAGGLGEGETTQRGPSPARLARQPPERSRATTSARSAR
jgi:hypothetical protein